MAPLYRDSFLNTHWPKKKRNANLKNKILSKVASVYFVAEIKNWQTSTFYNSQDIKAT